MKFAVAFVLLVVSSAFLKASVTLSGSLAVNTPGVTTDSVGVLVVDTEGGGFSALSDILSDHSGGVLESREDFDFSSTGFQPIGSVLGHEVFGPTILGGTVNFDIAPSGDSAVVPGDSFALVVFADPGSADGNVFVFLEDDWIVPGDGSTVTFASELTQLDDKSSPSITIGSTSDGGSDDGGSDDGGSDDGSSDDGGSDDGGSDDGSSDDGGSDDGPTSPETWFSAAYSIDATGWLYYEWFKAFKPGVENWIYHERHGWLYVIAEGTSLMFFWDSALGRWMFTNDEFYPWMYAYGPDGGWLFFYEDGRPGSRYFNRGDNGQVVSEQDLSAN